MQRGTRCYPPPPPPTQLGWWSSGQNWPQSKESVTFFSHRSLMCSCDPTPRGVAVVPIWDESRVFKCCLVTYDVQSPAVLMSQYPSKAGHNFVARDSVDCVQNYFNDCVSPRNLCVICCAVIEVPKPIQPLQYTSNRLRTGDQPSPLNPTRCGQGTNHLRSIQPGADRGPTISAQSNPVRTGDQPSPLNPTRCGQGTNHLRSIQPGADRGPTISAQSNPVRTGAQPSPLNPTRCGQGTNHLRSIQPGADRGPTISAQSNPVRTHVSTCWEYMYPNFM